MKLIHALALGVLSFSSAMPSARAETVAIDKVVFDPEVWKSSLDEVKKTVDGTRKKPKSEPLPEEIRKQLKEKGIEFEEEDGAVLQWLSSNKEGLRASPGMVSLCGREVGEVVLRHQDGKLANITVSLYNRGDDGLLDENHFHERFQTWQGFIDEKLEVRGETRNTRGAVPIEGMMWRKGDSAFLLESSWNSREDRAEFIRLRIASVSAAANRSGKVADRSSLEAHVRKDDKGFTWIEGIPMVDQGQKGYCVVATIERVARYYGVEMDQHEMAQLANTDEAGTSGDEMEEAFQKVTGKIHVRTIKLLEFDDRQFERDVKAYNQAAKKADAWTFDVDLDRFIVHPAAFWSKADPKIFRDVKARQSRCKLFQSRIKNYIDQGIPVCWTLFLGMYKEDDIPQSWGGHMRMIIGYNFDDPEKPLIYYTDSWGEGHSKKTMCAVEGYCMTMALYAMLPNK